MNCSITIRVLRLGAAVEALNRQISESFERFQFASKERQAWLLKPNQSTVPAWPA
jgi:hypothetical protein